MDGSETTPGTELIAALINERGRLRVEREAAQHFGMRVHITERFEVVQPGLAGGPMSDDAVRAFVVLQRARGSDRPVRRIHPEDIDTGTWDGAGIVSDADPGL